MKKKVFSILLSFAMVITMMPVVTMTAYADNGLTVSNGGTWPATENIDFKRNGNTIIVLKSGLTISGTTDSKNIIISGDATNVTLSNLTITNISADCAIESMVDNLTITLVGDNQLGNEVIYDEQATQDSEYNISYGISNSQGRNINFTGSGNLKIYSKISGIDVGNLTSDTGFTGKLTIESFGAGGHEAIEVEPKVNGGVYEKGGNIDFQGGKFEIKNPEGDAVRVSDGFVSIKNSEVTALAEATVFNVIDEYNPDAGEFEVEKSTLNINAINLDTANEAHCNGIETASNIEIINSTVNIMATSAYEDDDEQTSGMIAGVDIIISGDNTNITIESSCNGTVYGIAASSNMYINGGTVKVKAASADTSYAFFALAGLTIANTHETVNGTRISDSGIYINATDRNAEDGFVIIRPTGNELTPLPIWIDPETPDEKTTEIVEESKVVVSKTTAYKNGKIKVVFKALTLSDGTKVTKYQVRRATNKKFTKKLKKYNATCKKSSNTVSFTNAKGLKKGTRYYYKIRGKVQLSDGTWAYTKWSKVKSIKCKKTRK